jgi:HK97 family phage major capsid protein
LQLQRLKRSRQAISFLFLASILKRFPSTSFGEQLSMNLDTEPTQSTSTDPEPTSDNLNQMIATAVSEGFAELRKDLAPARRFVNPVDTQFTIPGGAKRYSSLKNFTGSDADAKAYRFGMFLLGAYGKKQGIDFCRKQNIPMIGGTLDDIQTKTSRENSNVSSGFLVPDEFQNDLIDLREKYGVFRRNTKVFPMASDTRSDPRRVNGVTSYFVGESTAPSLSDKTWDRVRMTAKKLMVLTKYSNELNEDAVLNIGDDLAGEIAYAFALKEDLCGFTGDGGSQFGGITGIINALWAVDPAKTFTASNILGLQVASGTGYGSSYDSIQLKDFTKLISLVPEYAELRGGCQWYCSKAFWGSVMLRLALNTNGARVADIIDTPDRKRFMGYDVEIAQVMPRTSATNQICCLFGNLAMGSRLGDRRHTTIRLSEHALNAFEQDEIVIRGTERFDIVVHDVGDCTAAAGSANSVPAKSSEAGYVAGPIVGLVTGAS